MTWLNLRFPLQYHLLMQQKTQGIQEPSQDKKKASEYSKHISPHLGRLTQHERFQSKFVNLLQVLFRMSSYLLMRELSSASVLQSPLVVSIQQQGEKKEGKSLLISQNCQTTRTVNLFVKFTKLAYVSHFLYKNKVGQPQYPKHLLVPNQYQLFSHSYQSLCKLQFQLFGI